MQSLLLFFLASPDSSSTILPWVLVGVALVLGLGGGIAIGIYAYRRYRTQKIGSTQAQADSIMDFAREEAKTLKKEAISEAREEAQRIKAENDRQFRERNNEISKLENRLSQ